MLNVYPDYYKKFRCTADKCRHNCCIGWEIDIDPETADFYRTVTGEMGKRLKESISGDPEPHFLLSASERCPFLNSCNLCDIITKLGEEHLCDICTEHPRFHNELPYRTESGLGLCCEAAAELILGQAEPMTLEYNGFSEFDDNIIALRDNIISVLQNRAQSMDKRINEMLVICNARLPERSISQWAELFLGLERMDEEWTRLLTILLNNAEQADICGFNNFMASRQTEYEQLTVYFIYRHFAVAQDTLDASARAAFAALGYKILHALGAVLWTQNGEFTFEQQINIARLFSSEIEYSDENLDILLDELI